MLQCNEFYRGVFRDFSLTKRWEYLNKSDELIEGKWELDRSGIDLFDIEQHMEPQIKTSYSLFENSFFFNSCKYIWMSIDQEEKMLYVGQFGLCGLGGWCQGVWKVSPDRKEWFPSEMWNSFVEIGNLFVLYGVR